MADHNQIASGTAPWPYSGRGQRRPQTARAKRTNSPLELPEALRGRGQSPEGRRWRDLCRFYGNKLGAERLADEGTRALLLNLLWVTLRLERVRDTAVGDQPPTHTVLHLCQEQRTLLQELGLSAPTRSNGSDDEHGLRGYLEEPRA
jgi:hypothetical protein